MENDKIPLTKNGPEETFTENDKTPDDPHAQLSAQYILNFYARCS